MGLQEFSVMTHVILMAPVMTNVSVQLALTYSVFDHSTMGDLVETGEVWFSSSIVTSNDFIIVFSENYY